MHPFPPAVDIFRAPCIDEALESIRQHRLFLEDRAMSHTLMVLEAHEGRTTLASPVRAVWLATQGSAVVGAAMVCQPLPEAGDKDTVSLFVKPGCRGSGIGRALLEAAMRCFPVLAAFHTPEAQSLYQRLGLEATFFFREEDEPCGPPVHPKPVGRRTGRSRSS